MHELQAKGARPLLCKGRDAFDCQLHALVRRPATHVSEADCFGLATTLPPRATLSKGSSASEDNDIVGRSSMSGLRDEFDRMNGMA
jgi:hypothetical protein